MVKILVASVLGASVLAAGYGNDRPVGAESGGASTSTTLRPDAGTDPTGTRIPDRPAVPPVPGSGLGTPATSPRGTEH